MNRRIKAVLIFLTLALFQGVSSAQNVSNWQMNLATDSLNYLNDIALSATGETYLATIRNGQGSFDISGESGIVKLDRDGAEDWQVWFDGQSRISSLACSGDKLYFCGHATDTTRLGEKLISPNSAFSGCLNAAGHLIWLRQSDSISGTDSRIRTTSSGHVLLTQQSEFDHTYLFYMNDSGEFLYSKQLPGLSVSDMATDKNGHVFLTGMAVKNSSIDTLSVQPEFAYSNYTLKLNDQFVAEWIRYTPYVTFDRHHRIVQFTDGVCVFHREEDTLAMLKASVITYNQSGLLTSRNKLHSKITVPSAAISAGAGKMYVAYEKWNYANPTANDTVVILTFNTSLQTIDSVDVISHIPGHLAGEVAFKIANDSCGYVFGTVYNGDSITLGSRHKSALHQGANMYVSAMDLCNPTATTHNAVKQACFNLFPNPGSGIFTLQTDASSASYLQIYDLHGRLILASTVPGDGRTRIDLSGQPEGVYLAQIVTGNQLFYKRLVLSR